MLLVDEKESEISRNSKLFEVQRIISSHILLTLIAIKLYAARVSYAKSLEPTASIVFSTNPSNPKTRAVRFLSMLKLVPEKAPDPNGEWFMFP